MSARHLLRHLAIAYRHFHPMHHHESPGDHPLSEKHRVEEKFISKLAALQAKCEAAGKKGHSDAMRKLLPRIKKARNHLTSRMVSRLASRIRAIEEKAKKI